MKLYIPIYNTISNYLYTRKCNILVTEDPVLKRMYKPKVTRLGVLYMVLEADADLPEQYVGEVLASKMGPLNEAMLAMSLDGLIAPRIARLPTQKDEDGNPLDPDHHMYAVEIWPANMKRAFIYMILLLVAGIILLKVGVHHWSGIWQFIRNIYGKVSH